MNRLVATPVKAWGRFAKSASPPTCVGSYGSWSRWALAGSEADHERLKQRPDLVSAPLPELVQRRRAMMPNGDRAKVRPDAAMDSGTMLA